MEIGFSYCSVAALTNEKKGGPTLEFVSLDKANIQPVEGAMYYLTFTAENTTDHVMKTYRAKVWFKVAGGLHLLNFKQFKSSGKADNLGKRKIRVTPQVKARRREHGSTSRKGSIRSDDDAKISDARLVKGKKKGSIRSDRNAEKSEAQMGAICKPRPGELLSVGFYILLEEIRSQNLSWKYATARSTASGKWRSLSYTEKQPYVSEADMRFKKKHGLLQE